MLFLICLFLFSGFNFYYHGPELMKEIRENREEWENPKQAISGIEEEMSEELFLRYPLIEGYGALQILMGKNEENAFSALKGKDGMLYGANFWNGFGDDQKELAVRTRRLHDQLEAQGTKMGVVIFPMKIPEESEGYYGMPYNDYSELAEDFASWIRYYKVPLLDLHKLQGMNGLTHQEIFFRTDHHWTPRAAFEGYRNILQWMEQSFGVSLDPDHSLGDLEEYEQLTLPRYMLGSQGRETGRIFAGGMEDYTVIYPKKPGKYSLKRGNIDDYYTYQGSFKEALLDPEENSPGFDAVYNGKAERIYLHNGVDQYVSIRNLETDSGPKILLLRDSYATPIGAFLAQSFTQVDMLWTLQVDEEGLSQLLEENHYDYVLLALYPENLSKRSFPFGTEEER